ncbi:MAG: hypothetical protein MUO77_00805 [Anaerolineales bacterium]|nr:hypothetical protein [Anaerolineales bacterium]
MPITVEKLSGEPIIVATFTEPMNYIAEVPSMFSRILELRDTIEDSLKYWVIIEMSGIKPDFDDVMFSLGEARKASKQRRSDMPISLHMVGTGGLFKMIASAMSQHQYGEYTTPLHLSLSEALDVIRTDISAHLDPP